MTSRYHRQIVLPEVGPEGQILLGKARILVVGAGGLGAPALLYLAAAGVGRREYSGQLGIIDDDQVDASNLQRQIIYTEADQDRPKAIAAADRLNALNNEIDVIVYTERLSSENVLGIIGDYDIVIDGSDNFATKYLINDAAIKLGKPVVYGSILGFEGQVSIFWGNQGPCYRCIYPEIPKTHIPNCAEAGTLGGIAGIVGSIQAVEACKLALGPSHCQTHGLEPLIGRLLVFDALSWDIRKLDLSKAKDCTVCTVPVESISLTQTEASSCARIDPKAITLNDFQEILASGIPMTLIDVREANEWHAGHLEGAIHIPLGTLLADGAKHNDIDPHGLVVVYCQHGIRSAHAVTYLRAHGYEALNLLVDWPK